MLNLKNAFRKELNNCGRKYFLGFASSMRQKHPWPHTIDTMIEQNILYV